MRNLQLTFVRYPYNSLKSAIFNNSVLSNECGFNHIEFLGKFYIGQTDMVEILSEGLFLFSCKYSSVPNRRLFLLVNFIYSEKATKFCEISTLLLSYVVAVKSKSEISQNFVAFSEYMNFFFKIIHNKHTYKIIQYMLQFSQLGT